jgi:hypothetical protein
MKKLVFAAAMFAALSAGSAFADTIQNAFGNTVVVTYANGSSARYFFNEDGTFTGEAPGGSTMAGRWTAADGQLCLVPPSGQAPTCNALEADKNVGDTWTQTAPSGAEVSVTITAGRTASAY